MFIFFTKHRRDTITNSLSSNSVTVFITRFKTESIHKRSGRSMTKINSQLTKKVPLTIVLPKRTETIQKRFHIHRTSIQMHFNVNLHLQVLLIIYFEHHQQITVTTQSKRPFHCWFASSATQKHRTQSVMDCKHTKKGNWKELYFIIQLIRKEPESFVVQKRSIMWHPLMTDDWMDRYRHSLKTEP